MSENMILDSEEVYQERGKKYNSMVSLMDKSSLVVTINRLKKQGKEIEEIALELGLSNDEVNKYLKGRF